MAWGSLKWYHLADIDCICFRKNDTVIAARDRVFNKYHLNPDKEKERWIELLKEGEIAIDKEKGTKEKISLLKIFDEIVSDLRPVHDWEIFNSEGKQIIDLELKVRKPETKEDPEGAMVISPDGIYLFLPLIFLENQNDEIKKHIEDKSPDWDEDLIADQFFVTVDNNFLNKAIKNPSGTEEIKKGVINEIQADAKATEEEKSNLIKTVLRTVNSALELPKEMKIRANPVLLLHETKFSASGDHLFFEMGTQSQTSLMMAVAQWPCCNLDPGSKEC